MLLLLLLLLFAYGCCRRRAKGLWIVMVQKTLLWRWQQLMLLHSFRYCRTFFFFGEAVVA